MPDIFLSYTREDQATAQRFAEAFEGHGFSVWWDATLRSGEAYDQVTEEALRTAKAVVVLWSKKSVVSRWVRAEATLADRNRTLVPARIEGCDLPIMFELTQTADLSHWTGASSDPAWNAFFADVLRFIEAGDAPQPPATQSLTHATPMPPPHSTRPSIAVLPFVNRSDVKKDDIFAHGLVEDLTAALSMNPRMKVVASSAAAAYREGARDLRQIGRDLTARYLLEGNVRRMGKDLRVTAQLVEAESGNILWTQKFDRPLAELSGLQEDLVAEVAAHLGVQVHQVDIAHALDAPGDVNARDMLIRATAYGQLATRAGLVAAVAEAKRAVEIDANYAHAYALLAAVQGRLWNYRSAADPELAQEIVDNTRRARALGPHEPLVLGAVAWALAGVGKLQDALAVAQSVVGQHPHLDIARLVLGTVLIRLGRTDEGLAELEAIDHLAPNSWAAYFSAVMRSIAHLQAGRIGEAIEAVDRSLRLVPGTEALIQSALCLAKSNRWKPAQVGLGRLRDADPEISCVQIEHFVGDFYSGSNAADDFIATVRKLWDEASGEASPP
jgi:TolB-like protein